MEALEILQSFFTSVLGLFTGTKLPAIGISAGALFLAVILVKLSLSLIHHGFGVGNGGSDYRSGSSRKAKISDERKGDEY